MKKRSLQRETIVLSNGRDTCYSVLSQSLADALRGHSLSRVHDSGARASAVHCPTQEHSKSLVAAPECTRSAVETNS